MKSDQTFEIVYLPKEEWEHAVIPMRYDTEEYYDVEVEATETGYSVNLVKKPLGEVQHHDSEAEGGLDKLYPGYVPKSYAWGIVEEENGKKVLKACIDTAVEDWNNRLRITELWVHEDYRRMGIGEHLMDLAKQRAALEHRRMIVLETQSCNVGAIAFYQKQGFELIGFDSCSYSNTDIDKKEVRLEFGYFTRKKKKDVEGKIIIRKEETADYHETERMTLQAFWNKFKLGCDEHLLVHKMRSSSVYLPELSRVAEVDGHVVGAIFYARSVLRKEEEEKEILTFGPLCVSPNYQGCGVGKALLEETLKLAREAGYPGVVIVGEPDYYPLRGFVRCEELGITDEDGRTFDALMGMELVEGGLSDFGGRFIEAKVFSDLPKEETEALTKQFETPDKQKFPTQW